MQQCQHKCKSVCPIQTISNICFISFFQNIQLGCIHFISNPIFILKQSEGCYCYTHTQLTLKSHFILSKSLSVLSQVIQQSNALPLRHKRAAFPGGLPGGPVYPSLYNFKQKTIARVTVPRRLYYSTDSKQKTMSKTRLQIMGHLRTHTI